MPLSTTLRLARCDISGFHKSDAVDTSLLTKQQKPQVAPAEPAAPLVFMQLHSAVCTYLDTEENGQLSTPSSKVPQLLPNPTSALPGTWRDTTGSTGGSLPPSTTSTSSGNTKQDLMQG